MECNRSDSNERLRFRNYQYFLQLEVKGILAGDFKSCGK